MTIQPGSEYPPIPAQPPQPYYGPPRPTSGMAITSFVLGLVGGAIFAVLFGHLALEDIRNTGKEGKALAIIGLVFGYIQTAVWALVILSVVATALGV